MSSTNKTSNLKLNQWLGSDRSKREDFNEDNKLIDEWAGKIVKLLAKKVDLSAVVNNLNVTEEGFIMDARAAKTLNDKLNSIFSNSDNYHSDSSDNLPYGVSFLETGSTNSPFDFWGTVGTSGREIVPEYKQQLALPWDLDTDNYLSYRASNTNGWSDWYRIPLIKKAIKDVPLTNLSLGDKGELNYYVENGWCTVEFKNIAGLGTNIDLSYQGSELPYPAMQENERLEHDGETVGTIMVYNNGQISCHKISSELGFGTMHYQIDKSKY